MTSSLTRKLLHIVTEQPHTQFVSDAWEADEVKVFFLWQNTYWLLALRGECWIYKKLTFTAWSVVTELMLVRVISPTSQPDTASL